MSVHDADYSEAKKVFEIPQDEPIFVIRGQDSRAVEALSAYFNLHANVEDPDVRPSPEWFDQLQESINLFAKFHEDNPDRVKIPD